MIINKFEAIGILICVGVMSLTLFLLRTDSSVTLLSAVDSASQVASIQATNETNANTSDFLENDIRGAFNSRGEISRMVIDDILVGEGREVQNGDTVSV